MAASAILLVDDDQDTCASLSDIISDLGYQVDVAYDGPAALKLSQRQPYGLALLDYKLPGMYFGVLSTDAPKPKKAARFGPMRTEVRRTEARKVVRHFFTRWSTALVTLLPSFDSNFSGRLSNAKQCFQVSLSTS